MTDRSKNRDLAHEILGALIHCAVTSDPQSSPEGFKRAEELGLLTRHPIRATPFGRGVLRSLGLYLNEDREMYQRETGKLLP